MTTPDIIKENVVAQNPLRTIYLITHPDSWQCVAFPDKDLRDVVFTEFPTWAEVLAKGEFHAVDRDCYGDAESEVTP